MPALDEKYSFKFLDSPEGVEDFVRSLTDSRSIAVDTEGASFHRYHDRVYLLQLSGRTRGAIVDTLAMATPPGLGPILEDPNIEVVFHDADYDLRLLHQDYGWNVRGLFDTRVAAQLLGIRTFGLGALLEKYFGVKVDKRFQRADWSMRPLTGGMLEYAALDTRHLIDLRDQLAAALENLGRMEWAREEFTRIEGARWDSSGEDDGFLRIKGARELSRPQLAVLRELVAWRDGVARELDRAVFRVIGNEALLAVAQSPATSVEDLSRIKGVPRGMLAARGEEILAAVERGRGTPADKLPRFPKGKRFERDAHFDDRVARLKAVRDAAATRLDLDPGVLCSRERLESIARIMPRSMQELQNIEGVRRWQAGLLGDALLDRIGPG